ncbi:hypothetical protein I4U23_005671 [Adineta vaga]|nr:hypothetical protein I4U23_005671 [Adineta vaga]
MSEANNAHEECTEIVKCSDESESEEENSNKTTMLSMINEKLDLLLTKFDKIETSVSSLKQTVDILVNKHTTIDITLCKLEKDNADKLVNSINTENCCSKILELIEERALSFESAIEHASNQIKGQIVSSIHIDPDTIQTTELDESIFTLLQLQPKTPTALPSAPLTTSGNEVPHSHYDFGSSPTFTSNLPSDLNLDDDGSIPSTPFDVNHSTKRQKTDNQISTTVSKNLLHSTTTSKEPQIILTDPITQTTFQVMKDKHDRHQVATNKELLDKETGFRHLIAFLYSTLFKEEELKLSSVDGCVRGTKSFDPVRVGAIDKHLFDLYGARYTKFRTSNQYKEILNKKCSRIRTKFNKTIVNN